MKIDDHTAFMMIIANSEILKFNDFDLAVYKRAQENSKNSDALIASKKVNLKNQDSFLSLFAMI